MKTLVDCRSALIEHANSIGALCPLSQESANDVYPCLVQAQAISYSVPKADGLRSGILKVGFSRGRAPRRDQRNKLPGQISLCLACRYSDTIIINYHKRASSCRHQSRVYLPMVRCAIIIGPSTRTSVETKAGSRSFVTEVIVSALVENGISATRFAGSVRWCLCQLLLLVRAIAKAKATAGTVPCSKM
jgi:hypothetical protein